MAEEKPRFKTVAELTPEEQENYIKFYFQLLPLVEAQDATKCYL